MNVLVLFGYSVFHMKPFRFINICFSFTDKLMRKLFISEIGSVIKIINHNNIKVIKNRSYVIVHTISALKYSK